MITPVSQHCLHDHLFSWLLQKATDIFNSVNVCKSEAGTVQCTRLYWEEIIPETEDVCGETFPAKEVVGEKTGVWLVLFAWGKMSPRILWFIHSILL